MTRNNKSQDAAVDAFIDLVARLIARAHIRSAHENKTSERDVASTRRGRRRQQASKKAKDTDQ